MALTLACPKGTQIKIGTRTYTSLGSNLGEWYKYTNSSKRYYYLKLNNDGTVTIVENDGFKSEDEINTVIKYSASYASIWGYVCGQKHTADCNGTFEDAIVSLVAEAKPVTSMPFVDFGKALKAEKYTRNGKEHVDFKSCMLNGIYITRSDVNVAFRNQLVACNINQVRALLRLMGNNNERLLPTTELEKSNAIELLSRLAGADWWAILSNKKMITHSDMWIRVIKKAKGL